MSVLSRLTGAAAVLVAATSLTYAGSLERMALDPMDHNSAELTVVGPEATVTYSPADLEAMETYRLVTHTPWREAPAAFDGVLLRDLLIANGMEGVSELRIVAENDFAITMPREVWETIPILVATRGDGMAHTRRERGPIQFVMPMDLYENADNLREGYWVWMAARIEAGS